MPPDSSIRRVIFLFIWESSTTSICIGFRHWFEEEVFVIVCWSKDLFGHDPLSSGEIDMFKSKSNKLVKPHTELISVSVGGNNDSSKKNVVPNPTPAE